MQISSTAESWDRVGRTRSSRKVEGHGEKVGSRPGTGRRRMQMYANEPVAPGWVGRMQMRRIHMSGGRRAWRAYANELRIGRIAGHVEVEVQAVLALVLDVGGDGVEVGGEPGGEAVAQQRALVQVLRADGREPRGVADAGPGGRRLGRLEAALAGGRGRVGHAQELRHGAQHVARQRRPHPAQLPVVRGHHGERRRRRRGRLGGCQGEGEAQKGGGGGGHGGRQRLPVTVMSLPVTATSHLVTATSLPVTQPLPVTATSLPVTQPLPVTATSLPVTATSLPVAPWLLPATARSLPVAGGRVRG